MFRRIDLWPTGLDLATRDVHIWETIPPHLLNQKWEFSGTGSATWLILGIKRPTNPVF